MDRPLKAGRAALLSLVMLVVLAGPASAATPFLLAKAKPWHYWLSLVLAASVVGLLFMTAVGYVVRVLMLKYGVRVGRKAT
jgi:uncharacterized integral membrane protein